VEWKGKERTDVVERGSGFDSPPDVTCYSFSAVDYFSSVCDRLDLPCGSRIAYITRSPSSAHRREIQRCSCSGERWRSNHSSASNNGNTHLPGWV
jgi:hypothetical protein